MLRQAFQGAPFTAAAGVGTALFVAVSTHHTMGTWVWARWAGQRALLDGGVLVLHLVNCAPIIILGCVVARVVDHFDSLQPDDGDPDDGWFADVCANRFVGGVFLVMGLSGVHSAGAVPLGIFLSMIAAVSGGLLLLFPAEDSTRYGRIAAGLSDRKQSVGRAADPLFGRWSEQVRRRMARGDDDLCHEREEDGFDSRTHEIPEGEADPWAILGLERDASRARVVRRWKELCRLHHPDVALCRSPLEAVTTTQRLNAAYQEIMRVLAADEREKS